MRQALTDDERRGGEARLSFEREVGAGDDGFAQGADEGAELVAPVFAEVEPRGHGEEVGAVLDRLTEPLAFVGEAAGIVDQVTFPQPLDCRGPRLVVPRARCLERGPGHITRRGVQDERLDRIDGGADEAGDVTVTAELP